MLGAGSNTRSAGEAVPRWPARLHCHQRLGPTSEADRAIRVNLQPRGWVAKGQAEVRHAGPEAGPRSVTHLAIG